MPMPDVFGWDVGGAHVKVCGMAGGEVQDVAQWACPLWLGLDRLDAVLLTARQRWPQLPGAQHAVTMTGEMVDLFAHREEGVQRITAHLAAALAPAALQVFAGDAGWCGAEQTARHWQAIASANWLATARHAARAVAGSGVLVDIGSTTTDLIAFGGGQVLTTARSDAERLASGELVYQGVVRTPLCALAARIAWRGRPLNVMNEFFATIADVYRLTGELDPAHDLHPSADNAAKDGPATRQRLARMIGLDGRDGSDADWLDFARAWRTCQLQELGGQLQRVLALHGLGRDSRLVSAGCGDFLLPELAAFVGLDHGLAYGTQVARLAPGRAGLAAWAQVCAPCIAVASLLPQEHAPCGS
jgi:(4-(4-[2-(gamma-L-glutamylamino)ethyl]phenoxymethyl)furan-2-yl)methanamine synthase